MNEKNNGVRRRLEKIAAHIPGAKVAYNEGVPRVIRRKLQNQMITCEECGDRMPAKNLNAHLQKAYKHVKPKKRKVAE